MPLWDRKSPACSCLSVIACISWCREVYIINKINLSRGPCFYISCETLITCEIPIPHTIPRTIPRTIPGGIPRWIPGGIPGWIPGWIPRWFPGGIPRWIPRCCGRASWIVPPSLSSFPRCLYLPFLAILTALSLPRCPSLPFLAILSLLSLSRCPFYPSLAILSSLSLSRCPSLPFLAVLTFPS